MLAKVNSVGLVGIDGFAVSVEVDITGGLPAFEIVGLGDAAVKEARERVRSGIKNSGYLFPSKKLIVNMAPAAMRKEGSGFDLPIAVAIIAATGQIPQISEKAVFIGEISLDGSVNHISGILPMVISMFEKGYRDFYVPESAAREAAVVTGANIYPVAKLSELFAHLKGEEQIEKCTNESFEMINNAPLIF